MVERNLEEFFVRRHMRFARLLPSSASFSILVAFADITAISALAKMALSAMSTTCNTSAKAISPAVMISLAYCAPTLRALVEVKNFWIFIYFLLFYNTKNTTLLHPAQKSYVRQSQVLRCTHVGARYLGCRPLCLNPPVDLYIIICR